MKKNITFILFIITAVTLPAFAQSSLYSSMMVNSHGQEWTEAKNWDYVSGLVAKTILKFCQQYPDAELTPTAYGWCKTYADNAVDASGTFYNFKKGSLDNIASGKVLIDLYAMESASGQGDAQKYKVAAEYLYEYLRYEYSRINLAEAKDCFIHKNSYPYQMWLDGLYMGAAFYAEYVASFLPDDYEAWDDIALQFKTIHSHTYDSEVGLNYHAWSAKPDDENSFWANRTQPFMGCSKEFWGRGMGWYAAAIVDVLQLMPTDHPEYSALCDIFYDVAKGIVKWQDSESGVWYQLLRYDDSFVSKNGHRNYLEASASCMFTYALLKGLRLGLIDESSFRDKALDAYNGVVKSFISQSGTFVDIHHICRSAGLGPSNNRGRDGSADYYLDGSDVNIVSNEGKGIGSFIMASLEYERFVNASLPSSSFDNTSPTEFFDFYGRRVQAPGNGLFIVKRGASVSKVVF